MATIRFKTIHARRLYSAAFASCAAAVAMAYTFNSYVHHGGEGSGSHHGSVHLPGGGYEDASFETAQNGGGAGAGGHSHGGGLTGGLQSTTGDPPGAPGNGGAHGPGDGDESDGSGVMPNGENGLMILTDFVNGHSDGSDKDGVSGGEGAGGGAFTQTGGGQGDGQGGPEGSPSGGLGGGGPGPSGGGGFGGGGGGGGGGSTPPNGGSTPPNGGGLGGGDGDTICLLASAGCIDPPIGGGAPPSGTGGNTPPLTFLGPQFDGPVGGGGDNPPTVNSQVAAPAPEPATWMMLILGFGGLGQVLRTRRRKLA